MLNIIGYAVYLTNSWHTRSNGAIRRFPPECPPTNAARCGSGGCLPFCFCSRARSIFFLPLPSRQRHDNDYYQRQTNGDVLVQRSLAREIPPHRSVPASSGCVIHARSDPTNSYRVNTPETIKYSTKHRASAWGSIFLLEESIAQSN